MRPILLISILVSGTSFAQVASYVGEKPNAVGCADTFVVAPTITSAAVPGVDQQDLTNASNSLASAVSHKVKGSEILQPTDITKIDECHSKVVVVKVKNYHTEPARMGQNRGILAVQLLYFDSPASSTPVQTKDFEHSGAVHWGDTTPFENAVKSVASAIRHGL